MLENRKRRALITGVANERSLAYGIAKKLAEEGVEQIWAIGSQALERRARPLAEALGVSDVWVCDAIVPSDVDALFDSIARRWDAFDHFVHSIAYADKSDLEGRMVDTSREGFLKSLDVSVYTLIDWTKRCEAYFVKAGGGSIVTLSYLGAQRAIENYNMMGVSKAALEATVRYLARDLGKQKICINAVSAGPVKTLAASGIRNFRSQLEAANSLTPLGEGIDQDDVGSMAAFLLGNGGRHITGSTMFVDSGAHIV